MQNGKADKTDKTNKTDRADRRNTEMKVTRTVRVVLLVGLIAESLAVSGAYAYADPADICRVDEASVAADAAAALGAGRKRKNSGIYGRYRKRFAPRV
jgi:dTDP-4-amino-4,6-dideoxygalactose transaminase